MKNLVFYLLFCLTTLNSIAQNIPSKSNLPFSATSKIINFEGVSDGSIAFADIDGDSDLDVLITGHNGTIPVTRLYNNDGCGNYTEIQETAFVGVYNCSVAFADIDGDLDQDVLITGSTSSIPITRLYKNDGSGNFTEVAGTPFPDIYAGSVAFADIDGDLDKDVLITGLTGATSTAKLYRNDGSGNYTEITGTPFEAVDLSAIAFADMDGDHDLDVLITGRSNDGLRTKLYKNNGSGNYSYFTSLPFEQVCSGSVNFADIDGDLDQDILLTGRVDYLGNYISKLYKNDGSGHYSEISGTPFTGVLFSSAALSDVNGDLSQDIIITGSDTNGKSVAKLYLNDGNGNFTEDDSTPFVGIYFSSIAFADVDGDSDPDILFTGYTNPDRLAKLYLNNTTSPLSVSGTTSNIKCFGEATGTITITLDSGVSPYTFNWSDGSTGQNQTGLTSGNYQVTITDSKECTANESFSITQPDSSLTIESTVTNTNCSGDSTGTISLIVSGGTKPYSYIWSHGATEQNLTGLTADNYEVTVTDYNECTATLIVPVTANPQPESKIIYKTNYCAGTSGGTITVPSTESGVTYQIKTSPGDVNYKTVFVGDGTNHTWSTIAEGSYYVLATMGTCTLSTNTVTVVANPLPTLVPGVTADDSSLCSGESTFLHANAVSAAGIASYTWNNPGDLDDFHAEDPYASPANTTIYTVTVVDNHGCSKSASVPFTVNALPSPNINSGTGTFTICNGGNISLTATPAGQTYLWNTGSTSSSITISPSSNTIYYLTLTDANGCSNSTNQLVTVNPVPTANAGSDTLMCSGVGVNLNATAAGGVAPYSYLWNGGATPNSATNTVTPPASNSFTVTVTDFNGCKHSDAVYVTVVSNPTVSIIANPNQICDGSSSQLTAFPAGGSPGYIYVWSGGLGTANPITVSPTNTVFNNPPINYPYSVTITDIHGCVATNSTTVTVNSLTSLTISNDGHSYCQDAGIQTLVGTPAGGTWTDVSTPGFCGGTNQFDPAPPTTPTFYTIQYNYTNSNSCVSTLQAQVQILPYSTPNIDSIYLENGPDYCHTDAAPYNVIGYMNPDLQGLTGIVESLTFSGAAGYTDNGDGTGTLVPQTAGAGTYTMTYTVQTYNNQCNASTSRTVNIGAPVTFGFPHDLCVGDPNDSLTATPIGGTWDINFRDTADMVSSLSGVPYANGELLTNQPGTYVVTYNYTNSIGCSITTTDSCVVHALPDLTFKIGTFWNDDNDINYCSNHMPVLLVGYNRGVLTGGGNFTDDGSGSVAGGFFSPSMADANNVIYYHYTDGYGCANIDSSKNVSVNTAPTVDITNLNATYCGNDPAFTITGDPASGNLGYGTFTFPGSWTHGEYTDNGDGTAEIDPTKVATTGTINVTYSVADTNGCSGTKTETFTINAVPIVDFAGMPANGKICKNAGPIQLTGSPTNSNGVFTPLAGLTDNGNGTVTFDPNALTVGVHSITYTFTNPVTGCVNFKTKSITINPIPNVSIDALGDDDVITCAVNQVQLNAVSTENPSDITGWQWTASNGGTIDGAINTSSTIASHEGNYYVQIEVTSNDLACYNTDTVTVGADTNPPSITIDPGPYQITCTNLTPTLSAAGDADPLTSYLWTGPAGATISANTGLVTTVDKAGAYTLTATGTNGCINTAFVIVSQNLTSPNISLIDPAANKITCTVNSVEVTGNSTTTGATYLWTGPSGATISAPTNSNSFVDKAGTYTLQVTNPDNGCTASLQVTVNIDTVKPTITALVNNDANPYITCNNSSVQVQAFSSVANAAYTWNTGTGAFVNSGAYNQYAEVTASGTYTVIATNPVNGCTDLKNIDVNTDYATPTVSIAAPSAQITCSSPTLQLDASGTIGASSYSWVASGGGHILSGATTTRPTVDATGRYTFTAYQTTTGCSASSFVDITSDNSIPDIDVFNSSPETLTCNTAIVTLNADATALATKSIMWSSTDGHFISSTTLSNPTVDAPGTYSVTITNTNTGCSASQQVVVSHNTAIPSIQIDDPEELTCAVTCTYLLANASSADLSPLTYRWVVGPEGVINSGSETSNPLVSIPATYYLTVTDEGNGCSDTSSVVVTSDYTYPNIYVTTPASEELTCSNNTVQVVGGSVTPGVTFLWTGPAGAHITTPTDSTTYVDMPGVYYLNITNPANGCTITYPTTVNENKTVPVITALVNNDENPDITCSNTSVQLQTTSSVANVFFTWNSATGIIDGVSGEYYQWAEVSSAGNYTVVATDPVNGCQSIAETITVAEDYTTATTTSIISAGNELNCNNSGVLNLTASITGDPGTGTYFWSGSEILVPPLNANNVNISSAGTYFLTYGYSSTGCLSTDSIIIIDNSPTTANAGLDQTLCASNSTLDANSPIIGVGQWSVVSGLAVFDNANLYNTSVSGLNSGNNILRWTITNSGCSTFDDMVITNNLPTTADAGPNQTLCASNSTLTGNSPIFGVGEWSVISGSAIFENTHLFNTSVSGLSPGDNILLWTITNTGCSTYDEVVITNNLPTSANAGSDQTLCTSNSVLAANSPIIGGGEWSAVSGSAVFEDANLNNTSVSGLNTGANILRWTINNAGCSSFDELTITYNKPTIGIIPNPDSITCKTLTVTLTGIADDNPLTTYLWTGPVDASIADPTSLVTSVNKSGTYIITATNPEGCSTSESVTVKSNTNLPDISVISPATQLLTCAVDSVQIIGNSTTLASIYFWTTNIADATITSPASASTYVNKPGEYMFSVIDSNNGCSDSMPVIVIEADKNIYATAITKEVNCYGESSGSITLSVTGGVEPYAFSWSNSSSAKDQVNLVAGNYQVTVSDVNHCLTNEAFTINQPDSALIIFGTTDNIRCFGDTTGTISLLASGGTKPYTFTWSNGSTEPNLIELIADNYGITVTDDKGCTKDSWFSILQPASLLSVSGTSVDRLCNDESTGHITLTVSGGNEPYSYHWSNGSANEYLAHLEAGNYSVTVTDANICSKNWETNIFDKTKGNLSGTARFSNGFIETDDATVELLDASSHPYQSLSEVSIQTNGFFSFSELNEGSYLVYIKIADHAKQKYKGVMSSYYNNTFKWSEAQIIPFNCGDTQTINVTMFENHANNSGNGKVSGSIYYDYGTRKAASPVSGASVTLVDDYLEQPVNYTSSDLEGFYEFSEIAIGKYTIYVDIPGISLKTTYQFEISAQHPQYENMDFSVNVVDLEINSTNQGNSIDEKQKVETRFEVYPNPAKDYVLIKFSDRLNEHYKISLFSNSGNLIKTEKVNPENLADQSFKFRFLEIRSGNYLLKIESEKTVQTITIVVIN